MMELHLAGTAPCREACPAGVNAQAYVSLIAERRFREALQVVRERMPFAGICGRICTAPCERLCPRRERDGAVAIRALKRFVADLDPTPTYAVPPLTRPERIAIVGAGPAGLTCALDLRRLGYRTVIYEAANEPGGMLAATLPAFRLPRETVRAEIDAILATGIELHTGVRVARDISLQELLATDTAAAFLAVGAELPSALGVPGSTYTGGVLDALTFLRGAGDLHSVGGTVLVVGGGSTAVDAARSALRAGADEVRIIYRRSRAEMPAAPEEVAAAIEEGIILETMLQPKRVAAEGGCVSALECIRTRLGEPDASGRRRPIPVSGSEREIPADWIIAAIGQQVDGQVSAGWEGLFEGGRLCTDPETLQTSDPRIFAGGDAVLGPATLVEAVGHGHRAAEAIDRFLRTGTSADAPSRRRPADVYEMALPPSDLRPRVPLPHLSIESRRRSFEEAEGCLSEEAAISEARRCLRCGSCAECRLCASSCPRRLVAVPRTGNGEDFALARFPAAAAQEAGMPEAYEPLVPQVRAALCRGCGRCVEVCAYGAPLLKASAHNGEVVEINRDLCRGCGICVGECPTAALDAGPLDGDRLRSVVRARVQSVLQQAGAAPLLMVRCQWPAADLLEDPEGPVATVYVPCAGRFDAGLALEALAAGARGVVISTCAEGTCKYGTGVGAALERAGTAAALLRLCGIGPDALRVATSGRMRLD